MSDMEKFNEIKELVADIEKIYYDKHKKAEATFLIESLYGRCDVDWLIEKVEERNRLKETLLRIKNNYALPEENTDYIPITVLYEIHLLIDEALKEIEKTDEY